ncbi:MAG: FGGY-family carbohydrate kinase [Spirochaetia bacterium]|jgi:sugar (pentulose or hexulose) kinase|nr:FGGY-family carbohydrate kinase [Spirochaetia bacterium]
MDRSIQDQIYTGKTIFGIEIGSSRIKAVLIDQDNTPIASGGFGWENTLKDGMWTYSMDEVWNGVKSCYSSLLKDIQEKYNLRLTKVNAIGISGMMHGYLVFDKDGNQLTPFRTWRNNITGEASKELTELFSYPIPQRWSIAHLYQAILKKEPHVDKIDYITTLAGYVHWKLTGQKVLGIGEASGMFPIDLGEKDFNLAMIDKFDTAIINEGYNWNLKGILPNVLVAGESAGSLTSEGAIMLDPSGDLEIGISICPPEGDAGTGMVATNSIAVRTGNISAGTSVFAMLVLEEDLSIVHPEIDLVTTPDGSLVGMAHSNNCTSDYDAWISLFGQVVSSLGFDISTPVLYDKLLGLALKGDSDCGGLLSYGYISGEHLTGFSEGRPLFVRSSDSKFSLENFMRTQLFTSLCALRTGLNILIDQEHVKVDVIKGHGGFFKTPLVGQKIMAAATNIPVSVLETAGEGGAWGIALLASYMVRSNKKESLSVYLEQVFKNSTGTAVKPDPSDVAGFRKFFNRYHKGLPIEQEAVDTLG